MSLLSLIPWPGRLLALAVMLAGGIGFGYLQGLRADEVDELKAQRDGALRVVRIERKQAEISDQVATDHEAGRARDRVVYRTIEKEVVRYVANPDHHVARLDRGWVCQHDAAAMSGIPDPACSADARPSDFTTDDALRVGVGNYEACNDNARQLRDLQGWVAKQRRGAESPGSTP